MQRRSRFLDDRLIGALGVVIGVSLLLLTPYAVRTSTALIPGTDIVFIRGDFYPRVTSSLLIVTGFWLLISDTMRHAAGRSIEPWPGMATSRPEYTAALAFLAGTAAYVFVVVNVGFAVASVIAFFALAKLLGGKLSSSLLLAVVGALVMELVFGRFFGIPLPGRILA